MTSKGKHERKRRRFRELFGDGSARRLRKLPSIITRATVAKEKA